MEATDARRLESLIDEYYRGSSAPGATPGQPPSDQRKRDIRDEVIDRSIVLIDQHYSLFVEEFSSSKKSLDSATDIGSMATASAAVLFTPTVTKSILAAVSGGLTASKASIDKNFLYDQTVLVLVKQMEAGRRSAVLPLVQGQSKPLESYRLSAALADIEQYYFAGTFDGALAAIQQHAAAEKTKADVDLAALSKDIEDRINAIRPELPKLAALLQDPAKRAQVLDALAASASGLSDIARAKFTGQVREALNSQIQRERDAHPSDTARLTALEHLMEGEGAITNVDKALAYLKTSADADAVAQAVLNIEQSLRISIPRP